MKLHRFYGECYGERWAASTLCGLKVLKNYTTRIDSEVTCKNCLKVLATYRKAKESPAPAGSEA